jgi:hypothetical protein
MLMARTDHALGDSVGRYRLIGELARGGMGIVYVAAAHGPVGFSKLVALKELRPELADDVEFLTMFLDEARLAARLSHPNIVQTNDVSEHQGRHFIAMEYLEGRSLYHVLKRFGTRNPFPQRMAISVLRDTLAALDYAHELGDVDGKPLGFVHRDISPHNVFVTFEGHTKVIDFGIAKARDSSLETRTGVLKGRTNYMAPEQLTRHIDRRSDIFSVGVMLFEILSGRRLWQGMGEVEILSALTRGEIPSPAALRPGAPDALVQICERALRARADERFATAAEMRDALDRYLWSTGGAPRVREVSATLLRELDGERRRTRALVEGALLRLQAGESGRLETLAQPPAQRLDDSRAARGDASAAGTAQVAPSVGREDSRVARDDSRVARDDSRVARDDSRVARDDSRVARDDSRVARDDSRVARDDSRVARDDSSVARAHSSAARDDSRRERDSSRGARDQARARSDEPRATSEDARLTRDQAVTRSAAREARDEAGLTRDEARVAGDEARVTSD